MLLGYQKAQKLQRWCWINFAFWGTLVSSCAVFSSLVLDAQAEAVEVGPSVVSDELKTPAPLKFPTYLSPIAAESDNEAWIPPLLAKQTDWDIFNGNPQIAGRNPIQFARGSAADLLRGTGENVAQTDSVQPEQQLDASPQEGSDPDLGTLRLQEPELPPQKPPQDKPEPILHLLPRIGFYQTNNVFSGVDPVDDGLIFGSLTLWAAPKLGPGTYLTASVEGNLIRYLDQSEFNYNLLRFRAGIRQRITPQMYGEIGWNNQQFFRAEQGDRFLNDQTVYLLLSRRDLLTPRLVLDSYYDFRANFSDPSDRSRITNALYLSLSYYLQRNFQVGLDYQFSRADFTRRDRQDQYHRIGGRVTYGVLGESGEFSVQGGLTVGDSSESSIDFDGYFFSVTYSIDLPIF